MADHWLDSNARAWTRIHGDVPAWATAGNGAHLDPADATPLRGIADRAPLLMIIGSDLLPLLADAPDSRQPLRVVVFEPRPAIARAVMAARDWTAWIEGGRLVLLVGPNYAGGGAAAKEGGALEQAPVLIATSIAGATAEVERARGALKTLAFGQSANDAARKASAGRYLLQTLANATRLSREAPVDRLEGMFPGRPAIVVAAGPSLDRNVHDLAPVLDRAVVIACDTAAHPLINLGVEPDFIVATDGSRANAGHLSSLPASRSWLVAEGGLHPSAFTHFDGRTFFFRVANHEPWPWLCQAGLECGTLGTWGSVATSAFSLALALGSDPIIFAGADFAFTDGRPYCRGTSFESLWATWVAGGSSYDAVWRFLIDRWPRVTSPDLRGQPTRTASHLVAFRDWIVERAAAHPDRRIVNATGAGLLAGAGIAQRSASSTLAGHDVLNRQALHDAVRASRRPARTDPSRLLWAMTEWLSRESPTDLPAWIAFSASTVTRGAIESAMKSPEYQAWMAALAALQAQPASAS